MPEFDGHHGPHDHHGGHGFHGGHGWRDGLLDGPDWLPYLLPGLLAAVLLALALLYLTGYDRAQVQGISRGEGRGGDREGWRAALARHDRTAREYAAFECDPVAVLSRPALADVTVPATARFVDAFAEATALRTDAYPGPDTATAFVRAADGAARAWLAAVDAADRIRVARFAPGERALLDRVVTLLDAARCSDHEAERSLAYRRAGERLAELQRRTGWALPRQAATVLEYRSRAALTA